MKYTWQVLACFILFFSVSRGAYFSVSSVGTAYVGVWTDYVFVEASVAPNSTTTLTLAESTGSLVFSSTQLQFDASTQAQSFRVQCSDSGLFQVSVTTAGDNGLFDDVTDIFFQFSLRNIYIEDIPGPVFIGQPSEPVQIFIDVASQYDLTFTPSGDEPTISFSPSSVVIPAGQLSATFTFIGTMPLVVRNNINWDLSGQEASLYDNELSGGYTFRIYLREITVPYFSGEVLLSAYSTTLYVYTHESANQSIEITPQAADTVFSPVGYQITSDTQVVAFTFNTSTPGNKDVFFYVTGETGYYDTYIAPVTIYVPKRIITVVAPSTFVLTNTTYMSIFLTAPAVSSVTVSYFAGNVQFNVSSVTFSGNQTSFAVAIYPAALGVDTISFLITGNDVDYYEVIDTISIGVTVGSFIGPDAWYIPSLWVGVESDKLPIRASFSPITSVTLTLSAPDVKFNPPTLTFGNGTEQQYFTITPLYVSNDNLYSSIPVTFLVSGQDHTLFSTPDPFTIVVNRRMIQNKWSAHLYDTTRHLQKPYKVWASLNYITPSDEVSVTPVSPYFSFNPPVLFFNSKTTRIEFIATVTGAVGPAVIDYIVGGRDGGWYIPPESEYYNLNIRPLAISAAVLAPDNRVPGQYIDAPPLSYLSIYHVYSIKLMSSVLPDSSLTITPRCNHATFSPSSRTLHASDAVTIIDSYNVIESWLFELPGLFLEANFTVTPLAAGTQEVWFELSGKDADYYDRPDHVVLFFNEVRRASSEPSQSSSLRLLPPLISIVLALLSWLM
jgi:hypothetical protein